MSSPPTADNDFLQAGRNTARFIAANLGYPGLLGAIVHTKLLVRVAQARGRGLAPEQALTDDAAWRDVVLAFLSSRGVGALPANASAFESHKAAFVVFMENLEGILGSVFNAHGLLGLVATQAWLLVLQRSAQNVAAAAQS